eukprot:533322_1
MPSFPTSNGNYQHYLIRKNNCYIGSTTVMIKFLKLLVIFLIVVFVIYFWLWILYYILGHDTKLYNNAKIYIIYIGIISLFVSICNVYILTLITSAIISNCDIMFIISKDHRVQKYTMLIFIVIFLSTISINIYFCVNYKNMPQTKQISFFTQNDRICHIMDCNLLTLYHIIFYA